MTVNVAGRAMQGDPAENIPKLVADTGAGLLVNDYSPLRLGRKWKDEVCLTFLNCPGSTIAAEL